jgi:hypothetical protein
MAEFPKVWRINVSPVLTGWGLPTEEHSGRVSPITGGSVIVTAVGCSSDVEKWHTTRRAALLEAANRIEEFIAPAMVQVAKLREEAGE